MSNFHDVRFPIDISMNSSGGPERSTEIVLLGSGHEHRNQRWADSRRRYEVGYGIKNLDALHTVVAFYEARRGPLFAFRFRDPLDWKSRPPRQPVSAFDQVLGIGDGEQDSFPLVKSYGSGDHIYQRKIEWVDESSLRVAVDGQELQKGEDFTLEDFNRLQFLPHAVPLENSEITAGFEFDVPVRFESDEFKVSLASFNAGQVPAIPLVEVRL